MLHQVLQDMARERYAEFLREAELERMLRRIGRERPPLGTRLLRGLGRRMARFGLWLLGRSRAQPACTPSPHLGR